MSVRVRAVSYFAMVIVLALALTVSDAVTIVYAQNESNEFPFNPQPDAPDFIKNVVNKILSFVQYIVTAVALLYVFLNVYYFTRGEAAPDVKRNIFIGILVIILVWTLPKIIQWLMT